MEDTAESGIHVLLLLLSVVDRVLWCVMRSGMATVRDILVLLMEVSVRRLLVVHMLLLLVLLLVLHLLLSLLLLLYLLELPIAHHWVLCHRRLSQTVHASVYR